MKEKVSQREKIYRTLASASRPSHQPSLYSILQYYRRENPVIQETQVVKENTPLLNVFIYSLLVNHTFLH